MGSLGFKTPIRSKQRKYSSRESQHSFLAVLVFAGSCFEWVKGRRIVSGFAVLSCFAMNSLYTYAFFTCYRLKIEKGDRKQYPVRRHFSRTARLIFPDSSPNLLNFCWIWGSVRGLLWPGPPESYRRRTKQSNKQEKFTIIPMTIVEMGPVYVMGEPPGKQRSTTVAFVWPDGCCLPRVMASANERVGNKRPPQFPTIDAKFNEFKGFIEFCWRKTPRSIWQHNKQLLYKYNIQQTLSCLSCLLGTALSSSLLLLSWLQQIRSDLKTRNHLNSILFKDFQLTIASFWSSSHCTL